MFEGFRRGWYFGADGDAGGGGAGGSSDAGANGATGQGSANGKGDPKPLVFDDWLKAQPVEVKSMLDSHTSGLKSALGEERKTRSDLEKQLREVAGKAEKGSEAEKKLIEMADQMAENDRRAEFYDEAHRVGVTNLKLAYLAAVQEGLFDKRGRVDFVELKKDYPELFGGAKAPAGNAGNGTNKAPEAQGGMNAWIRKAAGRG